jgi:hypothetical protein
MRRKNLYLALLGFVILPLILLQVGPGPEKSGRSIQIGNGYFQGTLHDNRANQKRQGAGFNPLTYYLYPRQNIFRDDAVGLNFEHIMNGSAADAAISMFTPRKDNCTVEKINDSSAVIVHKAKDSSWHVESEMTYTLTGENCIDLQFRVILSENKFLLGYIAFMWASYMNCTVDRRLHFRGKDGTEEGWLAFGEDTEKGFETGTIAYSESAALPYEAGAKVLNIIENPQKKFTLPFYYGLVHGSGLEQSVQDTMVYIVMFDQTDPIRFAMWNFFTDADGRPDTHSPAWDWQYIIRNPQIDQKYGYRARIIYKPYRGRDDIKIEYEKWENRNKE